MILTFRYRLLPTKPQHRALEAILESQRQLYNAGLEERIDAYRKPVALQRWTLKQLDEAYRAFFRRVKVGGKPGFPRFRGKGRFDSFGFLQFQGIHLEGCRLRFKGFPGTLRIHVHRPFPGESRIQAGGRKGN